MQLPPDSPIRQVTLEIESHAADTGWDQPPRLFALVSTQQLLREEPALAEQLGVEGDLPTGALSSIEQEELPTADRFEATLAQIAWPEMVEGCAAVVERVMLSPDAEAEMPEDVDAAERYLVDHPDRQEVRIVAAVDREGNCRSTVRARHTDNAQLLEGPDLVPTLIELLKQTLAD